jgi:hypothetical protein
VGEKIERNMGMVCIANWERHWSKAQLESVVEVLHQYASHCYQVNVLPSFQGHRQGRSGSGEAHSLEYLSLQLNWTFYVYQQ